MKAARNCREISNFLGVHWFQMVQCWVCLKMRYPKKERVKHHVSQISIAITLGNPSLHLRTHPYQIAGLISIPHPSNSPLIYINIPFLMVPIIPSYPLKSHHKTFIKLTCSLVTLRKTRVKPINHPPNHHNMVQTWYKPFPNGWFMTLFYPLHS